MPGDCARGETPLKGHPRVIDTEKREDEPGRDEEDEDEVEKVGS